MRPVMHHPSISAVRADALFVSALQRCEHPSTGQVRQAVAAAVRTFGEHGCAERMAQEFGDHPETAAARMRWARELVGEAFSARGRVRALVLAHRSLHRSRAAGEFRRDRRGREQTSAPLRETSAPLRRPVPARRYRRRLVPGGKSAGIRGTFAPRAPRPDAAHWEDVRAA